MLKKLIMMISLMTVISFSSNAEFELAYSGYNAFSMSLGLITQASPEHFLVVDDRVFYFINERSKERFEDNLEENIEKADQFFSSLNR